MAVMFGMNEDSLGRMLILVHHCERIVAVHPLNRGFQPTPWTCPACDTRISDPDELTYSVEVFMDHDVELVP